MHSFGLQNLNRTFLLTSKPLNMWGSTLFIVCVVLNTLFLLFYAFQFVIASVALMLCHFNLEKHHSYLALSFLTTVDLFHCLF